jgi:hypothetical protein
MKNNNKYNTFTFNRELHQQTIEPLRSGEHYRALHRVCDSPKHGVLSSIFNLAALMWARQIYSIGLHGLGLVINVFVKEYGAES